MHGPCESLSQCTTRPVVLLATTLTSCTFSADQSQALSNDLPFIWCTGLLPFSSSSFRWHLSSFADAPAVSLIPAMLPPALKLPLAGVPASSAPLSPPLVSPSRLLSPKASPRQHNAASILATSASILSLTSLSDTDPLLRASRRLNTANITTLLSPFPSHTITHYVNLPAQRDGLTPLHTAVTSTPSTSTHPTALFATVQLLLSYGADPNRLNGSHSTALHLACETGREDVIVLLLVHGADPRLVNSRGQRCWETKTGQSVAQTGERSKLEVLVKRVWEDLRREKERQIMAAVTAASTSHSLLSPNGFTSASSLAPNPSTPAFFTRQHYQHDWYNAQTVGGLRSMLSTAKEATPLLAKALLWDESLREKEQQEQRVRADDERRREGQRHSLLHRMQRTMSETSQLLQERRQRRQTLRSGNPEASMLAQQQLWREQEEQRHQLQLQRATATQQSKQLYARLQRAEEAGRVHEIRAVMNEYEQTQVAGKRERLLRQMRRNSLWGVVEDRRRKKQQQERDEHDRATSAGRGKGGGMSHNGSYAFMTEPEGQEADPLPADHEHDRREAEEAEEEAKQQIEDGRAAMSDRQKAEIEALNDPAYFPFVPIKQHTRAYLSRSLTEHMTIIPPPPHLLPLATQPTRTVDYPPVTVVSSDRHREEKEDVGAAVADKQRSGVVWRDVSWQPSTAVQKSAARGAGSAVSRQPAAAHPHKTVSPHQSADRDERQDRKDAALLSAYIMREVDTSVRRRDNQLSLHPTSNESRLEQRKQLIQHALPDLSLSSTLYATLLAATTPPSTSTPSTPPSATSSPLASEVGVSAAEAVVLVAGGPQISASHEGQLAQ